MGGGEFVSGFRYLILPTAVVASSDYVCKYTATEDSGPVSGLVGRKDQMRRIQIRHTRTEG